MKNNNYIILILFIISNNSFAQLNDGPAPEATAVEMAVSFKDISHLKEGFFDVTPIDRKDGILVGELGIDGGNKEMILELAQNIASNHYGFFDSFLIAYNGKLLFESYFTKGRINLPHPQASATKTYTGLALGRAIQLGYLTMADLNKPLVSFLKDLDHSKFVEGADLITLHNALTNTSGIRISEEQRKEIDKNPTALKGQGQVQVLLENTTPITLESQSFKYGGGPRLIMQVIEAVVPGSAKDFIKDELFGKMGITNYSWHTAVTGLPEAGWRMNMTSRDMIKMGLLSLNKGKWNGEQLIPEDFIVRGTSRILSTGEDAVYFGGCKGISNEGYGYFWWNADLKYDNKNYFSSSAQGGGGQFIILIEELDLVVVATAHNNRHPSTLRMTTERVLPAFIQKSIPAVVEKSKNRNNFPILEGPYLGQKPPGITAEPFAPGIISKEGWEIEGMFSPNMKEFYFTTRKNKESPITVIGFRQKDNIWQKYIEFERKGEISFSPDGSRMHMAKGYKDRKGDSWSERKSLGSMFDRDDWGIMRLSASAKGTYVFDDYKNGDVIRISRLKDNVRQEPKKMGPEINSGEWTAHPFIAPDESYLIWDSERKEGYGDSDLYICFRQKDGSWGPAINMGDKVNSDKWDAFASVTSDGKYILFNRRIDDGSNNDNMNVDIYWVDAQIIEELRPKK